LGLSHAATVITSILRNVGAPSLLLTTAHRTGERVCILTYALIVPGIYSKAALEKNAVSF
jgi:hypothetical protein